jgi:uncharacterized protein YcbX
MADTIADFALSCAATALTLYPVKACAGMPVQEIELDASGLAAGDRAWAIVDAEGAVTWQGSYPRLALVLPRVTAARLSLHAAGADAIAVPADAALVPCRVKIWSDLAARHETFDAADAGDAVAAWLERVAGAPLRLVRLSEAARNREGNNALHVVFSASVAAIDAQLASAGHPPADPRRYRANIVLSASAGEGVEFIEESLEALEWQGGAATTRLEITAPCVRCPVPNVNPDSAGVDEFVGDTLTALSQRRRPGGTVFGVYARGAAGTRLRVGDTARMVLAF